MGLVTGGKMKQIITMIIAVACLVACTIKEDTHTALPDAAPRVVTVQQAELRALNAFVDYTGTLQADDARDITPATTAVVKSVAVDEGDAVAAGDLLVTLDEAMYNQANAQYEQLNKNYLRMKELYNAGSIDAQSYEEVETAWKIAGQNLQLMHENTYITAPVDGIITAINSHSGETWNGMLGMPLISMVGTSKMKAEVWITDTDLAKIKKGAPVEVRVDTNKETFSQGTVRYVAPQAHPISGLYRCEIAINSPQTTLRHNQFARLRIITASSKPMAVVPALALTKRGSVFVVNHGKAEERTVTVDLHNKHFIAIRSGIQPGEQVVVTGTAALQDGDAVTTK
jgi:RND family efflux transporter MFP subunit